MNTLLARTIEAHGGLERWYSVQHMSADLRLLDLGGAPGGTAEAPSSDAPRVVLALHRQWVSQAPFLDIDHRVVVTSNAITLESLNGRPTDATVIVTDTAWDHSHSAYWAIQSLWPYVTAPFVLSTPGFEVSEGPPLHENGQMLRSLDVRYPVSMKKMGTEHRFYFERSGLIKRHEYRDISGARILREIEAYEPVDGMLMPTIHSVYKGRPGRRPDDADFLLCMKLADLAFA